jgi:hypothetical protein
MDILRTPVEIYGKVKIECKEIDQESSMDMSEKNKAKHNVLYKYFPDKKSAQDIQEQQSLNDGLLALVANDESMF